MQIRAIGGNYYRDPVTGAIYANVYHQAQYGDESANFDFYGLNELGGLTLAYWKKVYLDFEDGFLNADRSNMYSASALTGYAGLHVAKTAALLKFVGATENVLKVTKNLGRTLGVAGVVLSIIDDVNNEAVGAGTVAKIGIGLFTTFGVGVCAPAALVYTVVGIGFGIFSDATLTDRIASRINNALKD